MPHKSQVEELFYRLQAAVGGNAKWEDLHPMHQIEFVNSVNTIIKVCSAVKGN